MPFKKENRNRDKNKNKQKTINGKSNTNGKWKNPKEKWHVKVAYKSRFINKFCFPVTEAMKRNKNASNASNESNGGEIKLC